MRRKPASSEDMSEEKPCSACAKKGRKKGKCNCNHSDNKKAMLTPDEYLDACDLGIQDRSPTYIRTRLDVAAGRGQGQKCGKGYIGRGKKCRSGAGGLNSAAAPGGMTRGQKIRAGAGRALNVAGNVGQLASTVGLARNLMKGDFNKASKYSYATTGFSALAGQGDIIRGKATGNKALTARGRSRRTGAIVGAGLQAVLSGDAKRTVNAARKAAGGGGESMFGRARKAAGRTWRRRTTRTTTARRASAGMLRGS